MGGNSGSTNIWRDIRKPITALAPMEDVTDTVFRRVVAAAGKPDILFTEFVNADGLCSEGHDAVAHRLVFTDEERPIVAQIWGNRPESFRTAAQEIRRLGFDGIDINMGCPVKKIVKGGACSALIEAPSLARELVLAAREGAGGLPLSIKTRLGFRKRKTVEWASFLLELGPEALIVHGRTAREMSDVPADWNEIGRVVELRNDYGGGTAIIGNGDVTSMEEAMRLTALHGVDGVMVGRGIFHDLFLFRGLEEWKEGRPADGPAFSDLPVEEKIHRYRSHIALQRLVWGEEKNFNVMKKFAKVYLSAFEGAARLRASVMEARDYDQMLRALDAWLAETPAVACS